MKSEGLHGLFKGLPSLLLRQVPYTVGQFVSFEFTLVVVKHIVEPFFSKPFPGPTIERLGTSGFAFGPCEFRSQLHL